MPSIRRNCGFQFSLYSWTNLAKTAIFKAKALIFELPYLRQIGDNRRHSKTTLARVPSPITIKGHDGGPPTGRGYTPRQKCPTPKFANFENLIRPSVRDKKFCNDRPCYFALFCHETSKKRKTAYRVDRSGLSKFFVSDTGMSHRVLRQLHAPVMSKRKQLHRRNSPAT